MTAEEKLWDSLAGFLSGNCSPEERLMVDTWLSQSAENRAMFRELQAIWQSTGLKLTHPEVDSNALLQDLRNRISKKNTSPENLTRSTKRFALPLTFAAAISLVVAVYFYTNQPPPLKSITVTTGNEVATFYLPDSTKVWLNVNSKVEYPEKFTVRQIKLQGEAFMSVKKDTTTFVVLTSHSETTVIGTAFNIREQSDSLVTITVARGTVQFGDRDEDKSVLVEAGEKASVSADAALAVTRNSNPAFASWREYNNPTFEKEKSSPATFLTNSYTSRKNTINQTVVEGTLQNTATLAAYSKITVELTYRKQNGSMTTVDLTVDEPVLPGKKITYRKRLLDILTGKQNVTARIKSAEATSKGVY